jgi:splicing factor 3A subunit 3
MVSSVLEATHAAHEDLEWLERLVVRELHRDPANTRDRLFQSHRIRNIIDLVVTTLSDTSQTYL